MANIVYIATSLDGFIARKDGNLNWLMEMPNPDNNDFGFAKFMGRIDGIIMGRNTFETVLGFNEWPYTKPVFVLSNSLTSVPEAYQLKATIVKGNIENILEALRKKGIEDLYIDGGKTIQSFLKKNLIDELIITRVPIILGTGIPLFEEMDFDIKFRHIATEVFNEHLVKSHYARIQDTN